MAKKKVALVVDSAANLPKELVEQYDMAVVPLFVNWDGQSLLDGVDISPSAFYERLTRSST
ncbi:MAG: DegV family protein, partial [Anaerolineales bacterium]|nr:DegV family protein [Anaerolineales bacterium]